MTVAPVERTYLFGAGNFVKINTNLGLQDPDQNIIEIWEPNRTEETPEGEEVTKGPEKIYSKQYFEIVQEVIEKLEKKLGKPHKDFVILREDYQPIELASVVIKFDSEYRRFENLFHMLAYLLELPYNYQVRFS